MNKTIFRAKRIDTKEWVVGLLIRDPETAKYYILTDICSKAPNKYEVVPESAYEVHYE